METLINILSGLTAIDERTVNKINELSGRAEQYVLSSQVYSKDEVDEKIQNNEIEIQYISGEVDKVNIKLNNDISSLNTTIINLSSETSEISSFLLQQIISGSNDISIISSSLNNTNQSINYLSGKITGNIQNIEILSSTTQQISAVVSSIVSSEIMSAYLQIKDNVLLLNKPQEVSGIISAAGFQIHKEDRNLVLDSTSISLTTPTDQGIFVERDINLFNLNIGYNNSITGYTAASIGVNNSTSGSFSVTIGQHLKSNSKYQLIIGKYNQPNSTYLFSIGNGTEDNKRSNAFSVDISGNGMFQGYVNATEFKLNGHGINSPYGLPQLNKDAKIPSSLISWEGIPIDFKSSDYLPVSGGTLTGKLIALDGITLKGTHGSQKFQIENKLSDYNISVASNAMINYIQNSTQNLFNINAGVRNSLYGKFNLSFGYNNSITGNCNQIFSYVSPIKGNYNQIIGQNNQISGYYSSIRGTSNTISGEYNTSVGYKNTIESNYSHVEGLNNTIYNTNKESKCNYIYGYDNKISGFLTSLSYNFIHGLSNYIGGSGNIVIGQSNQIKGNDTFNIGHHLNNNGKVQHLYGKYNKQITPQKKYIEVIGWGTDSSNRKNVYTLDGNGNARYENDLTINNNLIVSGIACIQGRINSSNILNWQPPTDSVSHVGQVLVRTATGFTSKPISGYQVYIKAEKILSGQWIQASSVPVAIKTNSSSNKIYPIQAEYIKINDEKFYISTRPYKIYQKDSGATDPTSLKPWRIYLAGSVSGSGSGSLPGQNTVYDQIVTSNSTTLNFSLGDIQNLTIRHNTTLTILNLPKGSAMIAKCTLDNSYNVSYNGRVLINLPGKYFITFINISGIPEIMGDIVESNVIDY